MRLPDWEKRLADFVTSRYSEPFTWATNDCCTFAADAVLSMTGRDPAWFVRGLYDGPKSYLRMCKDMDSTPMALIDKGLSEIGCDRIPSGYAKNGDIVPMGNHGPLIGVAYQTGVLCVAGSGLTSLPRPEGAEAWHVPF